MVSTFTEKVLRTTTRLSPPSRRTPMHGWCADENVRRELDEAWDKREKAWKVWREAKGTNVEVFKRLQREGVQRLFDDHTRGLKRRIREGDSMGFYAHLKGANLENIS